MCSLCFLKQIPVRKLQEVLNSHMDYLYPSAQIPVEKSEIILKNNYNKIECYRVKFHSELPVRCRCHIRHA